MARVSGCNVVAHHAKIQDFSADFFAEVRCLCCAMCVGGVGASVVTQFCFIHDNAMDPLLIHRSNPGFLMGVLVGTMRSSGGLTA